MTEENYSRSISDRISDLPNCILGIILSFLRTNEAVATSLLSKRWKSAWMDVHTIDVYSPDFDSAEAFVRFVDRAFLLINARPLYEFSLRWYTGVDSYRVISWIDAAIHRKVSKITLILSEDDIFTLPVSGFNCDSLVSLRISRICFFYDTTMVCLPRLEKLKLTRGRFTSEEAFEKLINGCPMLRNLKLELGGYDDDDDDDDDDDAGEDFMYIISSPSLRHLYMLRNTRDRRRCTLKLNAPSVEYLRLIGPISQIFVEKSLSALIEADLDTRLNKCHLSYNSIVETVRAFEHAKFLTLSALVLKALSRATISLSTEFKRLVKLEVSNYRCCVQDFLLNSENLEELIILECHDYGLRYTRYRPDHSRWTAPVEVPRCLSKSLKKVQLDDYQGSEDGRRMIRYMLEHGSALELMQIDCSIRMMMESCFKRYVSFQESHRVVKSNSTCAQGRESPKCCINSPNILVGFS